MEFLLAYAASGHRCEASLLASHNITSIVRFPLPGVLLCRVVCSVLEHHRSQQSGTFDAADRLLGISVVKLNIKAVQVFDLKQVVDPVELQEAFDSAFPVPPSYEHRVSYLYFRPPKASTTLQPLYLLERLLFPPERVDAHSEPLEP